MRYYYSTQPFLAWCLKHYFYGGTHHTFVAPFYPYRLPNPKSSDPYSSYSDYYRPWKDADDYDAYINGKWLTLKSGVHKNAATLPSGVTEDELKDICDQIEILFFYPIVYRVDIYDSSISPRLRKSGSGLAGSDEFLVEDLQESEFKVLFLDFTGDSDFDVLKAPIIGGTDPGITRAMQILQGRCTS